jgi:hypothetical protein
VGALVRHKGLTFAQVEKQIIEACNVRTYKRVIEKEIENAKKEVERARNKIKKI